MIDLPKPDPSGNIDFGKGKKGSGKTIEEYPPAQTVGNIIAKIEMKFNEERDKAKTAGVFRVFRVFISGVQTLFTFVIKRKCTLHTVQQFCKLKLFVDSKSFEILCNS